MIKQIKRIFLLLWIFCLPVQTVFSQHSSRNNYTGAWETPASWNPSWAVPQTIINPYDITIYGYITVNGSLTFTGTSDMVINDTLVILGDLSLDNNCDLTINNNAILIIRGNLIMHNNSDVRANGYLIITGFIDKHGPYHEGSFTSNDNPVKVFVGGAIFPAGLTDNKTNYPALDCTSPPTTPYTSSGCSYGNLTDIINDPIYPFFQSTCTKAYANSNSPVCTSDSITLTSSGGTAYSWSGPGGFISSAQNPSILNANTAMTGDYIVTIIAAVGCTVADTTKVTVNALPATPIITAGGPTTFCIGASVTLTSSAGTSYLWSTGATTASINITTAGSFTVKVTNASGCQSAASAATIVTVNALPATPTISAGGTTTFCADGSVVLNSSAGTGFFWSNAATTASINITTAGSFTVKVTNASGCQSAASAATVVTVNALPATPTITAGGPTVFCVGDSVSLNSSAGTSYLWSTGATTASINVTATDSYTIQITNVNGCQSAASIATMVTANAIPVAAANNNGPVCAGSALNLTGEPAEMTVYSWTGPVGFTSLIQNLSVSANATLAMGGDYFLTVTDSHGCTSIATTTIVVNALPLVNITNSSGSMCINDLRTLTGIPAGGTFTISDGQGTITGNILSATGIGDIILLYICTGVCVNKATQSIIINENPNAIAGPGQELKFVQKTKMKAELSSSDTGEWSLISGSGYISDVHSPTAAITELSVGENIFLWKVRNGNCEANAEIKITVLDLFIPSVITPNGDGKNDFFKISDIINRVELIIFNRWGNIEYTNNNYLNDWEGRNSKGSELPNDTYFYVLQFENGNIKKGSVLIKR